MQSTKRLWSNRSGWRDRTAITQGPSKTMSTKHYCNGKSEIRNDEGEWIGGEFFPTFGVQIHACMPRSRLLSPRRSCSLRMEGGGVIWWVKTWMRALGVQVCTRFRALQLGLFLTFPWAIEHLSSVWQNYCQYNPQTLSLHILDDASW